MRGASPLGACGIVGPQWAQTGVAMRRTASCAPTSRTDRATTHEHDVQRLRHQAPTVRPASRANGYLETSFLPGRSFNSSSTAVSFAAGWRVVVGRRRRQPTRGLDDCADHLVLGFRRAPASTSEPMLGGARARMPRRTARCDCRRSQLAISTTRRHDHRSADCPELARVGVIGSHDFLPFDDDPSVSASP